jgi:hypothetical protein
MGSRLHVCTEAISQRTCAHLCSRASDEFTGIIASHRSAFNIRIDLSCIRHNISLIAHDSSSTVKS